MAYGVNAHTKRAIRQTDTQTDRQKNDAEIQTVAHKKVNQHHT